MIAQKPVNINDDNFAVPLEKTIIPINSDIDILSEEQPSISSSDTSSQPKKLFFSWFSSEPKTIFRSKLPDDASTLNVLARKYEDYCRKKHAYSRGLSFIRKEYVLKDEPPPFVSKYNQLDRPPTYTTYLWLNESTEELKFKIYNGPDDEGPEEGVISDEKLKKIYQDWQAQKELVKKRQETSQKANEDINNVEIALIIQKKEEQKALIALKNELYREFILREKVQEFLNPLSFVQSAEFEKWSDYVGVGVSAGFIMLIGLITYFREFILAIAEPILNIIISAASVATLGARRFFFNGPEKENALNKNPNKSTKTHTNGFGFFLGVVGVAVSVFRLVYAKANEYLHFTSIGYILSALGIPILAGSAVVATVVSMPIILGAVSLFRLFVHVGHIYSHLEILNSVPKYSVKKETSKKPSEVYKKETLYISTIDINDTADKNNAGKKTIQYRVRPKYKIDYLSGINIQPDINLLKHQTLYFWQSNDSNDTEPPKVQYAIINPENSQGIITGSLSSLFDENPPKNHQKIIEKLKNQEEKELLSSKEIEIINEIILKKHTQLNTLITVELKPKDFNFNLNNKNYIDKYAELAKIIKNKIKENSSTTATELRSPTKKEQKKLKKLGIPEEHYGKLIQKIIENPLLTLQELETFVAEMQYQTLAQKISNDKENLNSTEENLIRKAAINYGHPYQLPIEEKERFKTQLVKRAYIQAPGAGTSTVVSILLIAGFIGLNIGTFGIPLATTAALLGVGVIVLTLVVAAFTVSREFGRFKTLYRKEAFGSHLEKVTARFHKLAQQPLKEKVAGYIHDPSNLKETAEQKKARYGCYSEENETDIKVTAGLEKRKKERVFRLKALAINADGSDLIILERNPLLDLSDKNNAGEFLGSLNLPEHLIHGYILIKDKTNPTKMSLYFYDKNEHTPLVLITNTNDNASKSFKLLESFTQDNGNPKPLYTDNNHHITRLSYENLNQMRHEKSFILPEQNPSQLFPHMDFGHVLKKWGIRKSEQHHHFGGINNVINLIFNPNAPEPDSQKGFYDTDFISTSFAENDFFTRITSNHHIKSAKTIEQKTILLEVIDKKIKALDDELNSLEEQKNHINSSEEELYLFDLFDFRKNRTIKELSDTITKLELRKDNIETLKKHINDPLETPFTEMEEFNALEQEIKTDLFVSTKNLEKQIQLARLNGISEEDQKNIKIERQATALIYLIGRIQDKRSSLLQEISDLESVIPSKTWAFFPNSNKKRINELLQKEQFHQCLLLLLLGEPIHTSHYHALFPNHALGLKSTPPVIRTLEELDNYFWKTQHEPIKENVFKSKKKVSNTQTMIEMVNIYFGHCPPNEPDSKEKIQIALDKIPELIKEASESSSTTIGKQLSRDTGSLSENGTSSNTLVSSTRASSVGSSKNSLISKVNTNSLLYNRPRSKSFNDNGNNDSNNRLSRTNSAISR